MTMTPLRELTDAMNTTTPFVMTARGPIAPADLGLTLPHEHIIAKPRDVGGDDPDLLLDDTAAALAEVERFREAGGGAILDATPRDYGRDAAAMASLATRTRIHLIVVTGRHKHRHAAHLVSGRSVDELAEEFVRELTEGIDGTGVRAGAIKVGTSRDEITPVEATVLRAAARAHLETGAPITTHTERGTMALEQVALLRAEGVDPRRVIVGHLDFRLDEPYLRSVLETGATIGFDQFGKVKYGPDEARARMVKRLVDAGHGDQILLSGDLARKSYLVAYGGTPGYAGLLTQVKALLAGAGLDEECIRRLLVDNPARALATSPRSDASART